MVAEVASASVSLLPTFKGGAALISKQLDPHMASAGTQSGQVFGNSALSSFKKFAAPLAAVFAGAKIVEFFDDARSAASNLQQSAGGVDAVFQQNAATIHSWAQTAATDLGLSEDSYNQLASVIGSQLKNSGKSMDEVASSTQDLIGLGADLAATFGGTTADAVSSLSSALRGERDPIEKYGVSLTQAAVDAKAAELGFEKVGGTLSTQANQVATLALIYDQTSAASGQFAAQTNTLAEQQQIAAAAAENLKAKFGAALLPVSLDLSKAVSQELFPAFEKMIPVFTKLIEEGAPVVVDLFEDGLLPAIESGGELATRVLPPLAQGFGIVFKGISPVLGLLKDIDPQMVITIGAFVALSRLQGPVVGFFDAAARGASSLDDGLGRAGLSAGKLPGILGGVTSFLGGPWGTAIGIGASILGGFALNEMVNAKARVDDLTASLDTNTGAITDNTAATVAKALQESGAFNEARAIGISLDDVTQAALGNEAATLRVNAALNTYKESLGPSRDGQLEYLRTTQNLVSGIGTQSSALQESIRKTQELKLAQGVAKKAQDELTAAYDAGNHALIVNGATLDENTAEGRNNRDALQGIIDKTTELIDASIAQGDSADTVASKMDTARGRFTDFAVAMGYPREQVNAFADEMLKIPTEKAVTVTADTSQAMSELEALRQGWLERGIDIPVYMFNQDAAMAGRGADGYADGGAVGGRGGPRSDNQLILASPGEHVFDASDVAAMGGQAAVYRFRQMLHSARKFADGGAVGLSSQAISPGQTFQMTAIVRGNDDAYRVGKGLYDAAKFDARVSQR